LALIPGTRLGVYEVTAQIGEGGMGQVYRATDTKLKRQVAIKILPLSVAGDSDRLARFQREAELLASLNHPHIAGIYGLEENGGVVALVMELVDGDDLSQRIARGAIPIDEALPIAMQIAEALEAAHEQGIIHRDLKPANIKVRPDGTVKVLDFGLAKALDRGAAANADAMNSPTLSMHATQAGIILGTAAYMSPEQAAGKPVDKRSDVWAFGVVVLEMLTGRPVFTGETVSHVLASVLKSEPDWTVLPITTPPPVRRLLRRCLEKDRRRRLADLADARLEIEEALTAASEIDTSVVPRGSAPRSAGSSALPWAATGLFAIALVFMLWAPWRKLPPSPAPLRLSAELGADISIVNHGDAADVTLSPDGTLLAFVARKEAGGGDQLYLRRLDRAQATPLSGTNGAKGPFFSPDGQWIAFMAGGKLKKIAVAGGAVVTLCDAPDPRGATWAADGTIVFSPDVRPVPNVTLQRVSAAGGKSESLTPLAPGEVTQRYPQALPGGRGVLFTSSATIGAFDDADLVVLSLPARTRKIVQRGGYQGRYLTSGHLVYMHEGTLYAAQFDLDRLEATGPPVPALEGIASGSTAGGAEVALSASGTLVYIPGRSGGGPVPINWLDRTGNATILRSTPANWANLRFAPDGRRLALDIVDGQNNIWVYEWARDTLTRLTSDSFRDSTPVWTPDGRRIAFASTRGDTRTPNLYWQGADGAGVAQRLTESTNLQLPASWHPSGRLLAFEEQNPHTGYDVMMLPMNGDDESGWKPGKPTVFLNSPFAEREPMFSPDGRWLAYSSDETGRAEVYVRPFPGPGGKWQISAAGGTVPTWSQTKRELFYKADPQQIMVVPFVVEGSAFHAEKPSPWPNARPSARGTSRRFDVHPDGERLALQVVAQTAGGGKQDHVTFIFNFFDELRRIAPIGK
jgi:serine/threonine protein kinase/Tol biopolymer transport system component